MKFQYDTNIEMLPPDGIEALQTERFREHLAYCESHSPYYSKLLKGIEISKFKLTDVSRLPLTSKTELSRSPYDFLACPREEIQDIVFTSGTTGEPCPFLYTGGDLDRNAYNEERCYRAAGVTASDSILLTCTMDRCFIAGLAYYLGARRVGAEAIRNGLSTLESHLWIMEKIQPTVIVGIASFLNRLAGLAKEQNIPAASVKKLICVGEPIRTNHLKLNEIGTALQNAWPQAELFATYDSTEIATSFSECGEHCGGHLPADLAYLEVIDDNGNPVPDGTPGEIVVTPFGNTGMPLVRYRSGDIGFLMRGPCACGRSTPRLGPILGRKSHLLKYKGTSIFPQVIFNTAMSIPEIENYYVEARGGELSDEVKLCVSLRDKTMTAEAIQRKLQVMCRARIPVEIVTSELAENKVFHTGRKPMHFFDLRVKK